MRLIRRLTEAEVICEFLKNEFYQKEYDRDRQQFEPYVIRPDLSNERENAVRRALLFRRRGHMWRELPADTQWYQIEFDPEDIRQIRVFPRAQWRKISNGSYSLADVVERIRERRFNGVDPHVLNKIHVLRYRFEHESPGSTVLLIGVDTHEPLTILEGNHRLAAALLVSPEVVRQRFRVFCGFSTAMRECCWYETTFSNLWHYARNRIRHLIDREADVRRALQGPATGLAGTSAALTATTQQSK